MAISIMDSLYSNYLHLVPSSSSAGALKFAMPQNSKIAFIQLDLETGSLPDDLSKESYLECKKSEYWNVGDGWSYKIFGADLSRYDGVVVWHSKDVRSMLILAMMSALYDGNILSCDVSSIFPNAMVGNLAPSQLIECLGAIKPISTRTKESLAKKYFSITHFPCVKKYSRGKFSIVPIGILKQRLLRNANIKSLAWRQIVGETMSKASFGEFYSSVFWDCLMLELICEGKLIISEMVMEKTDAYQYPLGYCLSHRYDYNGFDLRNLYSFKCFKPKVNQEYIIKNPRLNELQVNILCQLYQITSAPCKNQYVLTERVVMAYYANYSGTVNGVPISEVIDTIYAMAQPWRIKKPLIIMHGNIGSPEQCNEPYSGAADMFYTEIALSEYGRETLVSLKKC